MKAENKTKTDEPQSLSTAGLGGAWDGVERRTVWIHLGGKPFAIRRFTTRPPLIDGAAYGTEMVERRKLPDRRKPVQQGDVTGLCTVRDAVSFMFEKKSDVLEMYFRHEGKEWNVELRILRAEDESRPPNVKVRGCGDES